MGNGTKFGRPRKVDDTEHIATTKRMKADGHTGRDIAKYLGVSRATLYRYLADEAAQPPAGADRLLSPIGCVGVLLNPHKGTAIRAVSNPALKPERLDLATTPLVPMCQWVKGHSNYDIDPPLHARPTGRPGCGCLPGRSPPPCVGCGGARRRGHRHHRGERGGLLGAAYGASAIPAHWLRVLYGWPGLATRELVALATRVVKDDNLDFVLLDTVRMVEQLRREGRTLLIHCGQAHSCTPAVATLYGARLRGIRIAKALSDMRGAGGTGTTSDPLPRRAAMAARSWSGSDG